MRNLKHIMLFLMVGALLTFTSCSSDDGGGDAGAASGTVVAKIDGANFQSMEVSSSATLSNGGQNLVIIASNSDGNAFSFTILGYEGDGKTYDLGGGANILNSATYTETEVNLSNPTASTSEIWQAPYDDTKAGTISIKEETDTTISGTFSFSCKNVGGDGSIKTISEGSFNLSKQTL